MNRIVPLGLTPKEAKGWYIHNVLMPWISRGIIAIAVASITILSTVIPLESYLESTLILHMVAEHFLFMTAGFLLAYGCDSLILVGSRLSKNLQVSYKLFLKITLAMNKWSIVTFVAAALLTAYWYLPANFDAAFLSSDVHVEMHFTFLLVGGLVYAGSKMLTKNMKRIAPLIVSKAMGLYGSFLLLTSLYVYSVYPASEQAEAGVVMLIMMLLMDLTIMPAWLYNYFGRTHPSNAEIVIRQS